MRVVDIIGGFMTLIAYTVTMWCVFEGWWIFAVISFLYSLLFSVGLWNDIQANYGNGSK